MYATSTRLGGVFLLVILLGIIALAPSPADAVKAKAQVSKSKAIQVAKVNTRKAVSANAQFSWDAPSSQLEPGETVTVTATFGNACRNRSLKFQSRREGQAWATVSEMNTGDAPSLAFSTASYLAGDNSYRVRVGKAEGCRPRSSGVQTFTTTSTSFPS